MSDRALDDAVQYCPVLCVCAVLTEGPHDWSVNRPATRTPNSHNKPNTANYALRPKRTLSHWKPLYMPLQSVIVAVVVELSGLFLTMSAPNSTKLTRSNFSTQQLQQNISCLQFHPHIGIFWPKWQIVSHTAKCWCLTGNLSTKCHSYALTTSSPPMPELVEYNTNCAGFQQQQNTFVLTHFCRTEWTTTRNSSQSVPTAQEFINKLEEYLHISSCRRLAGSPVDRYTCDWHTCQCTCVNSRRCSQGKRSLQTQTHTASMWALNSSK